MEEAEDNQIPTASSSVPAAAFSNLSSVLLFVRHVWLTDICPLWFRETEITEIKSFEGLEKATNDALHLTCNQKTACILGLTKGDRSCRRVMVVEETINSKYQQISNWKE